MSNLRHTDYRGWEVEPSTRSSMHPITKYTPFRSVTGTTATTLFSLAPGLPAVNLIPNPSIESATISMYVEDGSTIAQDNGQAATGSYSLLVTPDNSAAGEGFYWVTPAVPTSVNAQYLSFQVEHYGSAATNAVELTITDSAGVQLATSGSSNLATAWTAANVTYAVPANTASSTYRVYVKTATNHATAFYVDKLMYEVRNDTVAVSSYVDGDQGIGYEWEGAANASASYKRYDSSVIRGIKLTNESSTSGDIVYVAFDTTATATTGIPVLPGATLDTNWPLDFRDKISVLAAQNTPTVSGVVWGAYGL